MGRDLQKRKRRSSRPTIKQSQQPKKPLNPRGNSLVAKAWNKNETLSQNYRRLGLTAKLGKATGGVEQHHLLPTSSASSSSETTTIAPPMQDPLAVTPASGYRGAVRSVKVERDADGKIVKVLRRENPLNDPLNDLEEDDDDDNHNNNNNTGGGGGSRRQKGTRVVDLLEQQANLPTEKHVRHQSAREREWLDRLVAKHGDDTAAMARDPRLNPMQQTAADIRRRLKAYHDDDEEE